MGCSGSTDKTKESKLKLRMPAPVKKAIGNQVSNNTKHTDKDSTSKEEEDGYSLSLTRKTTQALMRQQTQASTPVSDLKRRATM